MNDIKKFVLYKKNKIRGIKGMGGREGIRYMRILFEYLFEKELV